MSTFTRKEHSRTNAYGKTFQVREHDVRRDHWNVEWIARFYGSPEYRAADFLRRSNVGRGSQGCFVDPNAKCPVCGVPVFFYANRFGSRVYFDDLGPPWPRHPCTDNPMQPRAIVHEAWKPIVRRRAGEIQELISAANTVGLMKDKHFGIRATSAWSLVLVKNVSRSGERNVISGEFIDSADGRQFQFTCSSTEPIVERGDLISVAGTEISLLAKRTLTEIRFRDGDRIVLPSVEPGHAKERPSKATSTTTAASQSNRELNGHSDWFAAYRKYFEAKHVSRESFLASMAVHVTALQREGVETPAQLADRLNISGIRTAAGDPWSELLVRFLCQFIKEAQWVQWAHEQRAQARKSEREFRTATRQTEDLARKAVSNRIKNSKRVERREGKKLIIEFKPKHTDENGD